MLPDSIISCITSEIAQAKDPKSLVKDQGGAFFPDKILLINTLETQLIPEGILVPTSIIQERICGFAPFIRVHCARTSSHKVRSLDRPLPT